MKSKISRAPKKQLTVDEKINRRNFIAFGSFTLLSVAAYGGWRSLYKSPLETPGVTAKAHAPLRRALNKTELFFRRLYSNNNPVKTYPKSMAAKVVRVNSLIGMRDKSFKAEDWKLQVNKGNGEIPVIKVAAVPDGAVQQLGGCVFHRQCVVNG
ncbi:MAG: hypothetical protein EOP51_15765 [Sphingobacteriales bacterium]|nr:MAG: hypothetical protein EOP51_15765 [Sphingobacteriales bacterium]